MTTPSAFEYHAPRTLRQAIATLKRYDGDARVLAGGMSLVPMMKMRLANPTAVVDLGRVEGLAYIGETSGPPPYQEGASEGSGSSGPPPFEGGARGGSASPSPLHQEPALRNSKGAARGGLIIGPMTTHYAISSSDVIKRGAPLLAEVASTIGDVQVRNRGTIGGSIAQSDPAADLPAALLAHEATFVIAGGPRRRVVRAEQMWVDAYESALADGEILSEVRVPSMGERTGWAYEKLPNRASRFAVVGVAALVTKADDGTCERARIAVIGAGAVPSRAKAAERYLTGKPLSNNTLEQASLRASRGIDFLADVHGSAAYREHLTSELTRRALAKAVERA